MLALASCAGPPPVVGNQAVSDAMLIEWDDLDAAMSYAVGEHEWAVLTSHEPEQGVRIYEMVSITDETGSITFTKVDEDQLVSIEAHLGRFGDQPRERAFVTTLQKRLHWLRDRD